MDLGRRTLRTTIALSALTLTTGCLGLTSDDEAVPLGTAKVGYRPPQYQASLPGGVTLIRRGSDVRKLRRVEFGQWLGDGRYLVKIRVPVECTDTTSAPGECDEYPASILDIGSGELERVNVLAEQIDTPEATPWGKSWITGNGDVLRRTTPNLVRRKDVTLPKLDGKGDLRSFGDTLVVGDATYVEFSDSSNEEHTEEYGYLRVTDDGTSKVLIGKRIAHLWVSDDGSAILGTQQRHGEPCGGCVVRQQIVEIDPVDGTIAKTYGVPGGYDKSWRVDRIDKVGDRVAVLYDRGRSRTEVWVYDDGWSQVPDSDRVRTWWQGRNDRIELRAGRLVWVRGGKATLLPGRFTEFADIPGALLRPGA